MSYMWLHSHESSRRSRYDFDEFVCVASRFLGPNRPGAWAIAPSGRTNAWCQSATERQEEIQEIWTKGRVRKHGASPLSLSVCCDDPQRVVRVDCTTLCCDDPLRVVRVDFEFLGYPFRTSPHSIFGSF